MAGESSSGRSIEIPQELIDLHGVASDSFVTVEEFTLTSDVTSLPHFRDAFNHVLHAAESADPSERTHHLDQATEHLGIIATDTMHEIAARRMLQAEEFFAPRTFFPVGSILKLWRSWSRILPTSMDFRQRQNEVVAQIKSGRVAKRRANAQGFTDAARHFENAYRKADTNYNLTAGARWRYGNLARVIAIPIITTVVGGIVTGLIVAALVAD